MVLLLTLPYIVPIVDIDAHAQGEDVVEYVYPVKQDKWSPPLNEEWKLNLWHGVKED